MISWAAGQELNDLYTFRVQLFICFEYDAKPGGLDLMPKAGAKDVIARSLQGLETRGAAGL